jgi:ABC-type glutathione transport system ATPase component
VSLPLLDVSDLRIGFDAGTAMIDGLDLRLAAGEVVGLVGPSGAGKSLIARALVGLLPAPARVQAGIVRFRGRLLASAADFAHARGSGIAYVFQDAAASLHPLRRVGTQLWECLRVHARQATTAEVRRRIDAALDEVGLSGERRWLDAYPHQLSGGQRQRVMLALTLLPQPALLIADEPTSALDPVLARLICDLLADAAGRRGMGMLLISHDLPRVAEYCPRVYRLREGRAELQEEFRSQAPTLRSRTLLTPPQSTDATRLLGARELSLTYAGGWRWPWQSAPPLAVEAVNLALTAGQRLGVIGSSGSGKSTLARGLLGLMPPRGGSVEWFGHDLAALDRQVRRRWRARVQLVFQDPFRSLDPMQRVDAMLAEALACAAAPPTDAERPTAARAALAEVGLDASALSRYPSQFSGGQRQRLAIARALATRPQVLICDEATSALDHATQAQILDLLDHIARERGMALLFVSHDLEAVAWLCDSLLVLDGGRVVESGAPRALLTSPSSAALRALVGALPRARPGNGDGFLNAP